MGNQTTQLRIQLTTDGDGNVTASLAGVAANIKRVGDEAKTSEKEVEGLGETLSEIGELLEKVGLGLGIAEALKTFVEMNAESQKLTAQLQGVTGSASQAAAVFTELKEIGEGMTATNAQLVQSYIKLTNVGIEPTKELLESLGNIAAATGQGVDEVASGVASAVEGHYRALLQLGAQVTPQGDLLIVKFQGVTQVIENSGKAIVDLITQIGNTNFAGAQAAQLDTLSGKWQAFWKAVEETATAPDGVLGHAIATLKNLIDTATNLTKAGGSPSSNVLGGNALTNALDTALATVGSPASMAAAAFEIVTKATKDWSAALLDALHNTDKLTQQNYNKIAAGLSTGSGGYTADPGGNISGSGGVTALPDYAHAKKEVGDFIASMKAEAEEVDAVNAAMMVWDGTLGRLAESLANAGKSAKQQADAARQSRNDATLDGPAAESAAQKMTASLIAQAAALGLNHEQTVRYTLDHSNLGNAEDATTKKLLASAAALDQKTAAMKAAQEYEAEVASGQAYLQSLKDQNELIGLTGADLALATALQKAAKQPTADLTLAIIAQAAANYDLSKSMEDGKAFDEVYAKLYPLDALTAKYTADQEALQKKYSDPSDIDTLNDAMDKLTANYLAASDATKIDGVSVDEIKQKYKALQDTLDPAGASLRKYTDDVITLNQELATKAITVEKYTADMKNLQAQFNGPQTFLGRIVGSDADAQKLIGDWAKDLGTDFTKALMDGFKGKDFTDLITKIATQFNDAMFKNDFATPLQHLASPQGLQPGDQQAILQGIGSIIGQAGGSAAGGGGQGAGTGAALGSAAGAYLLSAVPIVGTILGGVIGGLLGGLFDSGPKQESLELQGGNTTDPTWHNLTDSIGQFSEKDNNISASDMANFVQAVQKMDNSFAGLLTSSDDLAKAQAASAAYYASSQGSTVDATTLISGKLNAMIAAVDPQWSKFLSNISSIDDRLQAFAGLQAITKELTDFQDTLDSISPDPIKQMAAQIDSWNQSVTDASLKLQQAEQAQDPSATASSADALKQAIITRYNDEIALVQQVANAIKQAQQYADQTNLSIAQKIAAVTNDQSGVISLTQGQIDTGKGNILGEAGTDPATALQDLNTWTGTVDAWLQSSTAQVNAMLTDETNALEAQAAVIQQAYDTQYAALEEQYSDITTAADAANAAQQSQASSAGNNNNSILAALQKQLSLAQQWNSVLTSSEQLMQSLQVGTSNPLDSYAQLLLLNGQISNLQGQVNGPNGADVAQQMLTLLQQRLQLIQSSNLYDKGSSDYLAAYNQTVSQIAQIEAIAGPQATQAQLLQQQIDAIQSVGKAVGVSSGVSSGYSAETNAKLQAIKDQEKALKTKEDTDLAAIHAKEDADKAAAQAKIDAINAKAADYYKWAQGEAQVLEDARNTALQDQLNKITGGLPVQDFIAEKQADAVDQLTKINDNLVAFLNSIGAPTTATGGNGSGGSGSPGGGGDWHGGGGSGGVGTSIHANSAGMSTGTLAGASFNITVNGANADASHVAAMVRDELVKQVPRMASALKRSLQHA